MEREMCSYLEWQLNVEPPVMFPASSPYRAEPALLVEEGMQGEDAYVERRDKFVNSYFYACAGIFINFSQDSVSH